MAGPHNCQRMPVKGQPAEIAQRVIGYAAGREAEHRPPGMLLRVWIGHGQPEEDDAAWIVELAAAESFNLDAGRIGLDVLDEQQAAPVTELEDLAVENGSGGGGEHLLACWRMWIRI